MKINSPASAVMNTITAKVIDVRNVSIPPAFRCLLDASQMISVRRLLLCGRVPNIRFLVFSILVEPSLNLARRDRSFRQMRVDGAGIHVQPLGVFGPCEFLGFK